MWATSSLHVHVSTPDHDLCLIQTYISSIVPVFQKETESWTKTCISDAYRIGTLTVHVHIALVQPFHILYVLVFVCKYMCTMFACMVTDLYFMVMDLYSILPFLPLARMSYLWFGVGGPQGVDVELHVLLVGVVVVAWSSVVGCG